MKKILKIGIYILCLIVATSCGFQGKTSNAELAIGDSATFSKDEIQSAMNVVMEDFKTFQGCELTTLRYDETISNEKVENDLHRIRLTHPNYTEKNVIALEADFTAGALADDVWKSISPVKGLGFTLIRENSTSDWTVEGKGFH